MAWQPTPDGSLFEWDEIKDSYGWRALLLGNGLSINVWDSFRYESIYANARRLASGGLTAEDRVLFDGLRTKNFELVLGELSSTIGILDLLGRDSRDLLRRYQSIQAALGEAIRGVHVPWAGLPPETFATIQRVLHEYEWVFSTSYDLLLYWTMGHDDDYGRLVDLFWGPNCRFDPRNTDIRARSIPVFFLHGAMHLVAEGSGGTRKLRRDARTLLDQFAQPIAGDPRARPLLVTEGSSLDKFRAIDANPYLRHAYEMLQAPYMDVPMVVFGSSLGAQDLHLTNALSVHPDRPVAVSMMPGPRRDLRSRQADIFGRVEASPLLFFDATTHPLGAEDLAPPSI